MWQVLGVFRAWGPAGMGNISSDPRPSPFSEERRVSHSPISDVLLKSHPSGADSEHCFRNLKVGSQGTGPRQG